MGQIDALQLGKLNYNADEGWRKTRSFCPRILTEVVNETAQEGLINQELPAVVLIMSLL